ncbi:CHD5-like protein-domain-containing protein [Dipodascopsis uninucleata]
MASVLLITIGVVLLSTVVSAIGSDNLAELAWHAWTKYVPSKASKQTKELRIVQTDAIAISTERSKTSPQDEFAKWAKLNRKLDKSKTELERLGATLGSQKAFFKSYFRKILWVFTGGLKIYVRIKYRRVPVFWLPKGLFPGWIEWVLSLTSAPRGSVSVSAWFFIVGYACKGLIDIALAQVHSISNKSVHKSNMPKPMKMQ